MARGWESKNVESQQEQAGASRPARSRKLLTLDEQDRARRRDMLRLDRTRVLDDLTRARHPRHRAQLESALAFLDSQLQALG